MRLPLRRLVSTLVNHPPTIDRELALPLAFLSSQKWSEEAASQWSPWIKRFNSLGYSCMSINVDCPTNKLEDFETELKQQIRQSSSPFPPLLFARGYNTLIAQTYVSSHPLSGLVLVDPPCSIADALKGTRKRAEELENHRLRREYSEDVHLLVTSEDDVVGTDSFERVKDWMDSNAL